MGSKKRGRRRITVTFPPEHPVWGYPPGERSARVRELVDAALGSVVVDRGIIEGIFGILKDIVGKLSALEEKVEKLSAMQEGSSGSKGNGGPKETKTFSGCN